MVVPNSDAVVDFAARLRELKERSGRSYSALAARVQISSSTLHRYCSGETVPGEYAVVERFAAACRVSREEATELRRRWLRAAAEREAAQLVPALRSVPAVEAPPAPQPPAPEPPAPEVVLPEVPAPEPARGSGGRFYRAAAGAGVVLVVLVLAMLAWPWSGAERVPDDEQLLLSADCPAPVRYGDDSPCVYAVQSLLERAGTTVTVGVPFGPETWRRVVAFQVLAGLRATGVVDGPTKQALAAGRLRMTAWTPEEAQRRIRDVFSGDPERAERIARCLSYADPLFVGETPAGARTWGLFQLSDQMLARVDGNPRVALDPEWNIQAALRVWRDHGGFSSWAHCDPMSDEPEPGLPR